MDSLYAGVSDHARLTDAGFDYGPAFRGVSRAWRCGDEVYTEVVLPEAAGGAAGFGLHPALFDAALHGGLGLLGRGGGAAGGLPFSWSGVRLDRAGLTRLRVRVALAGESALRLDIAGEDGLPVAGVGRLDVRPVERAQLEGAGRGGADCLFEVDWVPVPAGPGGPVRVAVLGELAAGGELAGAGDRFADLDGLERALAGGAVVPDVVLAGAGAGAGGDPAGAARSAATVMLGLVQRWLASEWLGGARLVVVTCGGVAVGEEAPDLGQAVVWGLVRSAQSEHPGRFVLADVEGGAGPDWAVLAGAGEPALAVREGALLAPRLRRAAAGPAVICGGCR